jgi:uncharacterized RDD family membrane protein YckC
LQPEAAGRLQVETPNQGGASGANASEPEANLPEWRQELSRRLQEIKLKREAGEGNPPAAEAEVRPVTAAAEQPEIEKHEPLLLRPAKPRKPRHAVHMAGREQPPVASAAVATGQASASSADQAKRQAPPVEPATAVSPAADVAVHPPDAQAEAPRWREIQNLIDIATAKLARHKQPAAPESEVETGLSPAGEPGEDKLILLSRTLAGLVDIIIVAVCASSFIFAVDVLDGIEVFDAVSMIYFVLLLLTMYFVYSFFFLGTTNQTIGMMLTDLRMVGASFERPRAIQILIRSITFLLGSAGLGIGLLWSCFDRQSRCLHDRISQTRVVRIPLY